MMPLRITLLIMSIGLWMGCKKNLPPSNESPAEKEVIYSMYDAFDLQKEGMETFNNEPEKSAPAFLKAAKAYLQNKMPKDAGICLGNAAHLYEEKFSKLDSALLLANQSLEYALEANDTLNIAHGYRYAGYLTGITGNPDKGIAMVKKSFPYYGLIRSKEGIAVCEYDMARIYGENKKWKEAAEMISTSTAFFKEKSNLQRIFNNNIYAMKIFHATSNRSEYNRVVNENEYLITSGKINPVLQQKYVDILNATK